MTAAKVTRGGGEGGGGFCRGRALVGSREVGFVLSGLLAITRSLRQHVRTMCSVLSADDVRWLFFP